MAFELTVGYEELPENLKSLWEDALSEFDFDFELYPDFDPSTWEGGFLPVRMTPMAGSRSPALQRYGTDPLAAGFELTLGDASATFRTASGRTAADFRAQCLAAATLAALTDGLYIDGQSGGSYEGDEAIEAALDEIASFEEHADEGAWIHDVFRSWEQPG
jgi:hypothetical protein